MIAFQAVTTPAVRWSIPQINRLLFVSARYIDSEYNSNNTTQQISVGEKEFRTTEETGWMMEGFEN